MFFNLGISSAPPSLRSHWVNSASFSQRCLPAAPLYSWGFCRGVRACGESRGDTSEPAAGCGHSCSISSHHLPFSFLLNEDSWKLHLSRRSSWQAHWPSFASCHLLAPGSEGCPAHHQCDVIVTISHVTGVLAGWPQTPWNRGIQANPSGLLSSLLQPLTAFDEVFK